MKTPLLVPNDSRDESRDKDSWGTNISLESEAPTSAVKRPGLTLTYNGTTTGQGVFIWPDYGGYGVSSGSSGSGGSSGSSGSGWSGGFGGFGGSTVVTIEDDELTFPVIVAIGDLIDGYYAMVENPPTPPGPDDDYWSVTAPDSRRYQAWSRFEVESIAFNSPLAWAGFGWTSGTSSTDCFCTTKLAASPEAAARQALRYLRKRCPGYYLTLDWVIGPNTPGANWVFYYPYTYRFVATPVDAYDAVITIINDTICTDVSYIHGTSILCATVYLTYRVDSTSASPGPAGAPSCAAAVDLYGEGIHIVRRV